MAHENTDNLSLARIFRDLENQKLALDQSAIVAITNNRGDIIYVNDQFCKISQFSREELLGQNHRIINSGYHGKDFFIEMWGQISTGNVWKNNIKNRAKDGSYYWVSTTITPFLDEQSKPEFYVSIRFDITKQKLLEEQLEEQLKAREESLKLLAVQNKQLEDFCHIISHNLRAPLYNMTMLSEILQNEQNIHEIQEISGKIKQVSDYLQETFDELISIIQVRNSIEEEFKEINVADSVNKILAVLNAQLETSNAVVTYNHNPNINFKYNKNYFESILLNLISNSIKYQSKERQLVINISSYIQNDMICLEVSDNGLGLNMELHGKNLFKLRNTFHKHPDSKGFGLFITKSQIESLGGKIEVESSENNGFCVRVYLTKSH